MDGKDKYKAVWVSHSSINDFLTCPKLYYYRHIYKDPISGHKITRMQPALALGGVVHDVIESLSTLPVDQRFLIPLTKKLDVAWQKVEGKKGGFKSKEEEQIYKDRAVSMLKRVEENPGILKNKAVKIKQELPHYWLNEDEEIILCGKIDWLEYLPEEDSVHIIDFKTGRSEESDESLQLPIYHLLVANTQGRQVAKASYWYLDRDNTPKEVSLPEITEAYSKVLDVAKRVKLARQLGHFKCPTDGCRYCIPMEEISKGKGELVGESDIRQDIYIL